MNAAITAITIILGLIGITAAVASGLYVVLAQWIGLNVPYPMCAIIALILVIAAIVGLINDAKEGD